MITNIKIKCYETGEDFLQEYKNGCKKFSGSMMLKNSVLDEIFEKLSLANADLRVSVFKNCIFIDCDFSYSNMSGIRFYNCQFVNCRFVRSDLFVAKINKSKFINCNFRTANFCKAEISDTKFENCEYNHMTAFFKNHCPEEGEFIGYKTVKDFIIKLIIPEEAKRSSATSGKCRCSFAKVLEIKNIENGENVNSVTNTKFNKETEYIINKYVYPDSFDENRFNECSNGIHFFMSEYEALENREFNKRFEKV